MYSRTDRFLTEGPSHIVESHAPTVSVQHLEQEHDHQLASLHQTFNLLQVNLHLLQENSLVTRLSSRSIFLLRHTSPVQHLASDVGGSV